MDLFVSFCTSCSSSNLDQLGSNCSRTTLLYLQHPLHDKYKRTISEGNYLREWTGIHVESDGDPPALTGVGTTDGNCYQKVRPEEEIISIFCPQCLGSFRASALDPDWYILLVQWWWWPISYSRFPDEAKRKVTILVSDSERFSENNAFQLLLITMKINFFEREGGQVITVRKNFIPETNIL